MKLNHALKASYIAISCAILSSTMPVSASNSNPFGFNKADSILSDMVFYQIGGGVGYMAPGVEVRFLQLNLGLVGKLT